MNSLIVIQASQGLAKFIRDKRSDIASNGVVIGHDARHNSAKFAALAANAFIAQRIPVWFFNEEGPTPMVAFGVNYFGAAAGIMVTASHVGQFPNTCSYKNVPANQLQESTPGQWYVVHFGIYRIITDWYIGYKV